MPQRISAQKRMSHPRGSFLSVSFASNSSMLSRSSAMSFPPLSALERPDIGDQGPYLVLIQCGGEGRHPALRLSPGDIHIGLSSLRDDAVKDAVVHVAFLVNPDIVDKTRPDPTLAVNTVTDSAVGGKESLPARYRLRVSGEGVLLFDFCNRDRSRLLGDRGPDHLYIRDECVELRLLLEGAQLFRRIGKAEGLHVYLHGGRIEHGLPEPPVGGHFRFRKKGRGFLEMPVVPFIGVFGSYPCQGGARSLRTPEEGMVIGELSRLGVLTVSQHLALEGPHRLRVAVVAAFTLVNIP